MQLLEVIVNFTRKINLFLETAKSVDICSAFVNFRLLSLHMIIGKLSIVIVIFDPATRNCVNFTILLFVIKSYNQLQVIHSTEKVNKSLLSAYLLATKLHRRFFLRKCRTYYLQLCLVFKNIAINRYLPGIKLK